MEKINRPAVILKAEKLYYFECDVVKSQNFENHHNAQVRVDVDSAADLDAHLRSRYSVEVENAIFLMRVMSPGSSLVNAKHFAPRSFSDAPTRYSSLSSMMRKRS